jgi:hypothetical protein
MISLAILIIITLVVDIKAYRKNRKTWNLVPCILAITVLSVIVYKDVRRERIRKMENVIIAYHHKDFQSNDEGFTYCFKKGSFFTLFETRNAEEIMYHGKYSINGNRIQINSSNYRGKNYKLPKEGVIRDSVIYWENSDSMKISFKNPHLLP